ncbi:MAG: acyl carrier protein [Candidatus Thiodiazotropha sp. (ex Rostrolucina anterorostrata)]|nr:acyl carrier protein [Candidatus Thiodiazotropha sp. (ex Rostrolucina anterorostrata)]
MNISMKPLKGLSLESVQRKIVSVSIDLADCEELNENSIEPTATLESLSDFGFDSLAVLQLVCEVEELYGISITNDQIADMSTLQDFAKHIVTLSERERNEVCSV